MKVAEHIDSSTLVKDLGKCSVCNIVWTHCDLNFVPGLIKGCSILCCPDCKMDLEKATLIERIKVVKKKHREINWFHYREGETVIEGHSFIFSNGDVISLYHDQGNCTLDDIIRYIQSKEYENDVRFDLESRMVYYSHGDVRYPDDPFTANNWW